MNKTREVTLGNTWRPRRVWNLNQSQLLFFTALTTGTVTALAVRAIRKR